MKTILREFYGRHKSSLLPLSVMMLLLITVITCTSTATHAQTADGTPIPTPSALSFTPVSTIYLPLIQGSSTVQASARQLQDVPDLGLIYEGLEADTTGICNGLLRIAGTNYCTHGPDLPPAGYNVKQEQAPLVTAATAITNKVTCDGNGTSGNRVQVLYVRASDRPDRYTQYLSSIRQWVTDADEIYYESAAETGGTRHIRFVHDAGCVVTVDNIVIPARGDDDFSATISALQAQGYNRSDRKYMIFVDANVYCGIGGILDDDRVQQTNRNNFGPSYGRNDNGCWNGSTAAHELGHNLGAVQRSAPNSTNRQNATHPNTWHCSDEYDVMCYADAPGVQVFIHCSSPAYDLRLDCNHDDYYHTNPPSGSYLATHWNTANNQFLIDDPEVDPDDGRLLLSGETLAGTISPTSDEDTYFFDITEPQLATIGMNRIDPDLDSYLVLYDPSGIEVARDDDSGGDRNSLISRALLTQSGRYRVVASSYNAASRGTYAISLLLQIPPACSLGTDGVVLYENRDYSGRCITLTGDIGDLTDNNFNDAAGSVQFVGTYATGWEVEIYEDANYGGVSTVFSADDPNLGDDPIGDNRASSVRLRYIGDFYSLVAYHSGQCLDVYNSEVENGTAVIQWPCHGGDNQAWELSAQGNEEYRLIAKHSGKCLGVYGASLDLGAQVVQWMCNGSDDQIFHREAIGPGYRFRAKHSGLCIDVYGATTEEGEKIIQWECYGGDNQTWTPLHHSAVVPTIAEGEQSPSDELLPSAKVSGTTTLIHHTVGKGDSLAMMAKVYNISIDAILAANPGLTTAQAETVGTTLLLPIVVQARMTER